ncbi:MAG: hypothetical protein HYT16_03120 [DPANN group archaeon]|nr:hypothetical protein [DPANN group archaeon]
MIGLGRLAWSMENLVDYVPSRKDRQVEQNTAQPAAGPTEYQANIKFEFPLYEYYRTTPSGLMKSIRRGFSPVSWRAASAGGLAGLVAGAKLGGPVGGLAGLIAGTYLSSQIKMKADYLGRMRFEIESPEPREKLKYYVNMARQNKLFLPWLAYAAKYVASVIAPKILYSLKLAASKIPRLGVAAPASPAIASPTMPTLVKPAEPEAYKRTISMAYNRSEDTIIVRYRARNATRTILEWDTYSIAAAADNRRRLDHFVDWLADVPRKVKAAFARPAAA